MFLVLLFIACIATYLFGNFFFAASGTEDFAYPSFSRQIRAMRDDSSGIFKYADNSSQGNLYYLVQKGNQHNLAAAQQYFYNGMIRLWR